MLDFKPVEEVAEKAVPSGMRTIPPPRYDFKSPVFHLGTSDWDAHIEAPFTIENARVIPGAARYIHR